MQRFTEVNEHKNFVCDRETKEWINNRMNRATKKIKTKHFFFYKKLEMLVRGALLMELKFKAIFWCKMVPKA